MAVDLTIRQGDTTPAFTATVTDASGNPVNLTGATSVKFVMSQLGATPTVNATATVVSGPAGTVSYSWAASDTAAAGMYMAEVHYTLASGATGTYPNRGFLTIEVQENLLTPSQQLISVAWAKDVLNMPPTNHEHDTKILRWINACRPVIEAITGPIILTTYDEIYDGGQYWIVLRHRPSRGFGTTPVLNLLTVTAYIGPIDYSLGQVPSAAQGTIYSCELDSFHRVVRRGPGGGVIPFPNMLQSVHIIYQAGQSAVPDNVAEATAELLRVNYQETAQRLGASKQKEVLAPPTGFFVPNRVRELLATTRRFPSLF